MPAAPPTAEPGSDVRASGPRPTSAQGDSVPASVASATQALDPDADIAIRADGLCKCYHVYDRPVDRLLQALDPRRKQRFREFWALHPTSFTVRRGETLGIIGRNGSGKSTLLQMVCGTLTPTAGTLDVSGRISALLELGAGFNRDFTGRENVYLSGAILGLSRAQIDALLPQIEAFAEIGRFIDQPVKTYSSGMYVRLAFAVAAHVQPNILVVDEALAVGDVFFQQRCARHMKEALAGVTKILVTHDMSAVAQHCERVLVLDAGRIVFQGPPADAIAHYTRMVHTATFGARDASTGAPVGSAHDEPRDTQQGLHTIPWTEVPADRVGGAGELRIQRVAMTDAALNPLGVVEPGVRFLCHYQVRLPRTMDDLIFGVMVNDRFGNPICGDNTCSLPQQRVRIPGPGSAIVTLEYVWPELRPGPYTATFGVGQGVHALAHDIQCWAHNIIEIRAASPAKPIHGLFNNPLRSVRVHPSPDQAPPGP